MKAIIIGPEQEIIERAIHEPTPHIIHGLYAAELAPPLIVPDYPEQIDELYGAEGLWCATMIMAHPAFSVAQILGPELPEKGSFTYRRQLTEQAGLMGPFALTEKRQRLVTDLGYRALGIWLPK